MPTLTELSRLDLTEIRRRALAAGAAALAEAARRRAAAAPGAITHAVTDNDRAIVAGRGPRTRPARTRRCGPGASALPSPGCRRSPRGARSHRRKSAKGSDVSEELESIGISLVLDDDVAEGIRRISREMALFNRQTEFTAAQMSQVARQHLGPSLPPEPERRKPTVAPVTVAAPPKVPTMPATEAPQAPSQAPWPMPRAQAPAPVAPRGEVERKPAPAAIAPMPNPPPPRPPAPAPQMSARPPAVVPQVVPQTRPVPTAQQSPPQPRPVPATQPAPAQPRVTPGPVAAASPRPATVVPPPPAQAPPSRPVDKSSARPKIQVALSTPPSPAPVPPPRHPGGGCANRSAADNGTGAYRPRATGSGRTALSADGSHGGGARTHSGEHAAPRGTASTQHGPQRDGPPSHAADGTGRAGSCGGTAADSRQRDQPGAIAHEGCTNGSATDCPRARTQPCAARALVTHSTEPKPTRSTIRTGGKHNHVARGTCGDADGRVGRRLRVGQSAPSAMDLDSHGKGSGAPAYCCSRIQHPHDTRMARHTAVVHPFDRFVA